MQIAYFHYLYGEATALRHVHQFAAAARREGHVVDVHALNLAPGPEPGPELGSELGSEPREGAGGGAAGPPPRMERALRRRARRALKRRFGRWLHEPKELLWNLFYPRRERALLAGSRPDVLLVRDHLLTASALPVARRLGLPLVLEVNAPAEESRRYHDQYLHLPLVPELLEGWKLRRAAAVTVVSTALARHLAERYGLVAETIHVVPNGADVERFHPGVAVDRDLAAWAGAGPVVGFVGSFQRWHGAELLAGMALAVGRRLPAARFVFVGDGPGRAAVERATAPLGERVLFAGRVPHERVPGLVAGFAVAVQAESTFYCCPLKVLEWMAAGKAVVAPGYAPLAELIEDGAHGLLFPPGDLAALAAAVERLAADPDLARRLGRAAAERVRADLTWGHNARRVVAACEAALARAPYPARTSHQPSAAALAGREPRLRKAAARLAAAAVAGGPGALGRARRRRRGDFRLFLLAYHDVTAAGPESEGTVSAERLRRHLALLRRRLRLVSLSEGVERLAAPGGPGEDLAVLTFDDGYAGNFEAAWPLLRAEGVPAAVFLTTGFLDGHELWFDLARRCLARARQLGPALPAELRRELAAALGGGPPALSALKSAPGALQSAPGALQSTGRVERWVDRLKPLAPARRDALLARLAAACAPLPPAARPLTWEQARALAAGGVELGCHTVSHPILATLPAAEQRHEIEAARSRIAEQTGTAPRFFAYPNGSPADYDEETVRLVAGAGFRAALTMTRGSNRAGADRLRLRRIGVGGDPAYLLAARLDGLFDDEVRRRLPGARGVPAAVQNG